MLNYEFAMHLSRKGILILIPPLAELFIFRLFLLPAWGLKIGFPGFTDYELFFPALLGFGAFLWSLNQESPLQVRFVPTNFLVHLAVLILFFFVNHSHVFFNASLFYSVWWLLLIALVITSFALFLPLKPLLRTDRLLSLLPALCMVFSLVIYFKWGGNLFESSIELWARGLESLVRLFNLSAINIYPFSNMVQIHHPMWTVHVGRGCAGFDSLIFFLGAFALFAPIYWKSHSLSYWTIFLLAGLALSLFLNFLRIILLFSVGIFLMRWLPQKNAIGITLNLFHIHLGYLLYGLGFATYFRFILALKPFAWRAEILQYQKIPEPI